MDPKEPQSSFPGPTDLERLKETLGLPLGRTSTCQAATKNAEKCETRILIGEQIDPILTNLLLEPPFTSFPPTSSATILTNLSKHLQFSCPQWTQHLRIYDAKIPVETLGSRFHLWQQSEKNRTGSDGEPLEGSSECGGRETSTPDEGLQRETVHETALDEDEYDEYDEDDEDDDEDDIISHSEYQPSEKLDEDTQDEDQSSNAPSERTVEELQYEARINPEEQSSPDMESIAHDTDAHTPTTPLRTTNNPTEYESSSEDDPALISEASTPIHFVFSPPEHSSADTPDTDIATSRSERRYSESYLESPSRNRGLSARSAEASSYFALRERGTLRPETPEPQDEERPNTPSNSNDQGSTAKTATTKRRSVSARRESTGTPLCLSTILSNGTKTATIYPTSLKANPLKEVLTTMRSIAYGDRLLPGHVYAYKDKSVPGHIKIGFAKDEQGTSKESHIVLKPVGKDKDLHLWKRLRDQEDRCMSEMKVLFAVYMPCAAGQMERLVHRTLFKEKRKAQCHKTGCNTKHIEWFDVDEVRALDVIMRWAEFSQLLPYNRKGCLGESWDDHAHQYGHGSQFMTVKDWWEGPWNDFRLAQKTEQLAFALEEEKRSCHQDEIGLLDDQLEIQLERNKLKQERNELRQRVTRLREEKVKRGLEQARQRQQELQLLIDKLSLS